MQHKKYLIVIGGATATGKTELAIALARHFQTEILSADSRQFYREMSIGTAKPSSEELAAAPHHFINSLSVGEEYSAGDFERDALILLDNIFQKKDTAILAGGSGLFIRAVCEGLDKFPPVPAPILEELDAIFKTQGIEPLQQELLEKDPEYYRRVDLQNPQRLMRALSVCRASERPFSSFQSGEKTARLFHPIYILLQIDREELYEKINRRVDWMMENGLLEEARALFHLRHLNALQTVGYQELFEHFEGEISLEVAVEKIKQNSRRYAKRQETWFRKARHWQAFSPKDRDGIIRHVHQKMESLRTNSPNSL
jgi:tRNA dimethylallyltransferase